MRRAILNNLGWCFCEMAFKGWDHCPRLGGFCDRTCDRLYDLGRACYARAE